MNRRRLPKPRPTKHQEEISTQALVYRKRLENEERKHEASARWKAQRLAIVYERSRRDCLAFCAKFHAALPRELRDLVYDQLIVPGKRHHVFEARDGSGQPRISSNPLVSVSFFDPRSRIPEQPSVRRDVWKYREYTGEIVAKEIAERWYHTGLFILDVEDFLLPKFLSTDVWEHKAKPSAAIRHLRLNIHYNTIESSQSIDDLLESFEDLSKIENKSTEIIFHLSCSYVSLGVKPLMNMLNLIRPTVYRLRAGGYKKVKIHQASWHGSHKDISRIHDVLAVRCKEVFQQEIPSLDERTHILAQILGDTYFIEESSSHA
ncbi:hypothetical protein BKA66DRAFT_36178 [Pyrenochaeta sp. MPI-SDFR-AT-0127]|nr:hypothetical protein BKA66DRAFT_36178 [Pyrenochaeta sp. MPI-SDFR-AT-0127]